MKAQILATTAAAALLGGCATINTEEVDLLAEAKAEHAAKLAREPYVCPLEPEVMPPIPALGIARGQFFNALISL